MFWAPKDPLLTTLHVYPWKIVFFEHVYCSVTPQTNIIFIDFIYIQDKLGSPHPPQVFYSIFFGFLTLFSPWGSYLSTKFFLLILNQFWSHVRAPPTKFDSKNFKNKIGLKCTFQKYMICRGVKNLTFSIILKPFQRHFTTFGN